MYAAPGSLQSETLRPPRSLSALWLNYLLFSPRNPQLTVTPVPKFQDTQFPRLGEGGGPSTQLLFLQSVVLEKILESPLDCKEIKPVNPKGNQL